MKPIEQTFSTRAALACCATAAALALAVTPSADADAHPTHKPGDAHHPHKDDGASDTEPDSAGPSAAEQKLRIGQLLKRTEERAARREEIRKDRRAALRRRLFKKLEGKPLNKSMKAELRMHAQRMARLHRIRYIAAQQNDYETIQSVDMLIGKENSRHETWWRAMRRLAVKGSVPTSPAGSASVATPKTTADPNKGSAP